MFKVLKVDRKMSIKDFVQRNSLVFKAGRGFYEFTKPETISHKKEVVLVKIANRSAPNAIIQDIPSYESRLLPSCHSNLLRQKISSIVKFMQ